MSTEKKKIWSTVLKPEDEAQLKKLLSDTGVPESVIIRGLMRLALKNKRIDLLKLVKIGSY